MNVLSGVHQPPRKQATKAFHAAGRSTLRDGPEEGNWGVVGAVAAAGAPSTFLHLEVLARVVEIGAQGCEESQQGWHCVYGRERHSQKGLGGAVDVGDKWEEKPRNRNVPKGRAPPVEDPVRSLVGTNDERLILLEGNFGKMRPNVTPMRSQIILVSPPIQQKDAQSLVFRPAAGKKGDQNASFCIPVRTLGGTRELEQKVQFQLLETPQPDSRGELLAFLRRKMLSPLQKRRIEKAKSLGP